MGILGDQRRPNPYRKPAQKDLFAEKECYICSVLLTQLSTIFVFLPNRLAEKGAQKGTMGCFDPKVFCSTCLIQRPIR